MFDKIVFTTKDISRYVGVHQRTVVRWIKQGKIKATKSGNRYYILKKNLNKFLIKN